MGSQRLTADAPEAAPSWTGPRLVGLVLLATGVLTLVATTRIPSARDGWDVGGPRFVPLVVSVALIALALAFLVRTVVRPDHALAVFAAAEHARTHWPTPFLVLASLVGYALLLGRLGFAVATTLFVLLSSWLLGSRDHLRDGIVGLVLGVVVGYAFSRWLGVRLPVGRLGV